MIWLSFKRWSSSSGSMFMAERIYRQGYRWTPFVMLRPRYKKEPNFIKIFKDGDEWCASIGPDLQEGIAGFGPNASAALNALRKNMMIF
ncbi:MAG: hypothetical protein E3J56_12680 [Candidatus Aminicenantes bacterium]|nr:MAG: hypothetical protein E3J56_12680 [Candidatus Aminicenantes bacterium]